MLVKKRGSFLSRNKFSFEKRGVSPLIATIILIGFVVAILVIVIVWARNTMVEKAKKEGELNEIKIKCTDVAIEVEKSGSDYIIQNIGGIDLDGFIVREDTGSNIFIKEVYSPVAVGENICFSENNGDCNELSGGAEKAEIIPALRPSGIGAPLIPCSDKYIKIKLS